MSVQDYSTNPDANTAISGINIGEGCNASNINDAIRQLMADVAVMLANGQLEPVGAIKPFGGGTAPTGYLMCDGSAVSRTTYSALFGVVGTTYGAGNGSSTFNVPDFRGRTVVGGGTGSGLTARALGATGGEETHTLTTAEVPAQGVSVTGTASSAGAHTHGVSDPGHSHGIALVDHAGASNAVAYGATSKGSTSTGSATTGISINSDGAHTHDISASGNTNGGGGAHNNMPPFGVANWIIKV